MTSAPVAGRQPAGWSTSSHSTVRATAAENHELHTGRAGQLIALPAANNR
uniref:Uncharacterized protein n=1 Tax=Micromonospora carbonacea TaxID=47853 RepID=A0A7D6CG24_9ACTN|nr:hypothetical protein HZU44_11760 [Micromonospora carbonacea]